MVKDFKKLPNHVKLKAIKAQLRKYYERMMQVEDPERARRNGEKLKEIIDGYMDMIELDKKQSKGVDL